MPSFPNLLKARFGRLFGFFILYMAEGLPQGYAGTAVALEFKRMGMTSAAIGTFAATIMLPWTWKWVMGPLVDNLHLKRFGRRKQWIVTTQVGMIFTLVAAILLFPQVSTDASGARVFTGFALFSAVLLANNVFSASQDVAIDALACSILAEHERGVANGLMFAGAQVGAAIGGSGVLFLKAYFGFSMASLLGPLVLIGILGMVTLLIYEHAMPVIFGDGSPELEKNHTSFRRAINEIRLYMGIVLRVFFLTRRGFAGLVLAVIPFGGMALCLTVSIVISPTLGMADSEIASLGLVSSLVFTACMALLNLGTVLCYWWQGQAITSLANGGWGFTYLQIFLLDAAVGSLFLLILPFMKPSAPSANGV